MSDPGSKELTEQDGPNQLEINFSPEYALESFRQSDREMAVKGHCGKRASFAEAVRIPTRSFTRTSSHDRPRRIGCIYRQ